MIAKQNLETKRAALTERIGKLAQDKLASLERIDAIGEEMRQLNLLVQVFDVTLADMEKDAQEHTLVVDELAAANALLAEEGLAD